MSLVKSFRINEKNKKKVLRKKSTFTLMSQANAFLDESENIIKNEEGICSIKEIKPPKYLLVEEALENKIFHAPFQLVGI